MRQLPLFVGHGLFNRLLGILALCAGLVGCGSTPASTNVQTTATLSSSFLYGVRVQNRQSGQNIPNAKVTIEVINRPPLDEITDSNGYANIPIDSVYAGKTGKLRVEAEGFTSYVQTLDLGQGTLPKTIQLEASQLALTASPTTAPTVVTETVTAIDLEASPTATSTQQPTATSTQQPTATSTQQPIVTSTTASPIQVASLFEDTFDGPLRGEWQEIQSGLSITNGQLVGNSGAAGFVPPSQDYSIKMQVRGPWQVYFRAQANSKGEITQGYNFACGYSACLWSRITNKQWKSVSNNVPRGDDFDQERIHTVVITVRGRDFTATVDDRSPVFSNFTDSMYKDGLVALAGYNQGSGSLWEQVRVR